VHFVGLCCTTLSQRYHNVITTLSQRYHNVITTHGAKKMKLRMSFYLLLLRKSVSLYQPTSDVPLSSAGGSGVRVYRTRTARSVGMLASSVQVGDIIPASKLRI
jgi:hypothetical protein